MEVHFNVIGDSISMEVIEDLFKEENDFIVQNKSGEDDEERDTLFMVADDVVHYGDWELN